VCSSDLTTVMPSSNSAGSWKHRDFPAPVGNTASAGRPAITARSDPTAGNQRGQQIERDGAAIITGVIGGQ
jgi:hypothetical protein